jgi:hypothetical protein
MLEIYCDSSYNPGGPSLIGCVIFADGEVAHQSTTAVSPAPANSLDCERAAIALAIRLARLFRRGDEPVTIYNDSTEAVKECQHAETSLYPVEFAPRDSPCQGMADLLSKNFPRRPAEPDGLCRRPVETFTPEVLRAIASGAPVAYLQKDRALSTNSRNSYRLIIRTMDGVLSDGRTYTAKAGEVKSMKVAREVAADADSGAIAADLSDAFFLLTDETWGLRLKGGQAYSILPCSVPHRIICHEVDRSPENLWRRAGAQRSIDK